ncbi:uncharacterized protein LOC100872733 [Apis florea]|uniref:uncharacterized protein LOC100872733 n=1 Tax=Apis florea TaxID=7463 RepID=UPI0006290BCE|nr:uncharacterized protein LOC100872733 [Apis florea]
MFSRAAKSIVKTIGQRKYPAGEENIKLALIGGAGEIGRSLSQMLKQSSKLDVLALYDVAALNKRFSTPIEINKFCDAKITNTANSRMLTMLEKSRTNKGDYRLSNVNENLTEDFVNIHRLPTAEQCVTNQYSKTAEQPQVRVFC